VDILRFGEGVLAENAIVRRSGDDLVISFNDSTDRVTVKNYAYSARYQVEHITFTDGTDWLPEDISSSFQDAAFQKRNLALELIKLWEWAEHV